MRKVPPVLVGLLVALLPLAAQQPERYRVGIAPFTVAHPEWSDLGRNLSNMLARLGVEGESRALDPDERTLMARRRRQELLSQARTREASARRERDRQWILGGPSAAPYLQAEEEYRKVQAERTLLEAESGEDSSRVPPTLRLTQVPAPDQVLEWQPSPDLFFQRTPMELLILPRLEHVRGYLGIDITVIRPEGQVVTTYRDWMSPEEVLDRLPPLQDWLVNVLLNRPWAQLTLSVEPSDAEIWVGDTLRGLGTVDLGIVEPTPVRVVARAGGFRSRVETIELRPGERVRQEWTLVPREAARRSITTDPPGARVWVGGLYRGETPLELPLDDRPQYLEIELAGHDPVTQTVWPDQSTLSFTLQPSSPARKLEEARGWFYLALGSFTLSFFSYILFRGLEYEYLQLSNDFLQDFLSTPPGFRTQEQLDKVNLSYTFQQTFQNGGYALLGLTAVLFGWTVWELFRYIDVAERGR